MAFYPKKLHNLQELEREKLQLEKQLLKLEEEELFSLNSLKNSGKGKKNEDDGGGDILSTIMGSLPIANPWLDLAMSFVKKRFMSEGNSTKSTATAGNEPGFMEKGKAIAKKAAIEVVTGYLKWKAIELSYKGVTYLVKKRREEKILRKMEEDAGY